jgi:citrate lyase subunit beta-like protein
MPKIHSARDLDLVSGEIFSASQQRPVSAGISSPIRIVASIESARGMWSVGDIGMLFYFDQQASSHSSD